VATDEIGTKVLDALKQIDSVAYIRFASVYRDFAEARDFEEFAATLREFGGE
jgi:transcriptional repressor NrdR